MISFKQSFCEQAEEHILSDMDSYTEWLSVQCASSTVDHCRIVYVPRDDARRAMFIDTLDVPQLVALSLYPCQQYAGEAMWALRQRYLADQSTVRYLQRVSQDYGPEAEGPGSAPRGGVGVPR